MDETLRQLFREIEMGDYSKFPALGLALRRAGMTLDSAQDPQNPTTEEFHSSYFWAPQSEADMDKWAKGVVYWPWSPPAIGTVVQRLSPSEEQGFDRVDVGTRHFWGRVVGVVTNPRNADHHCKSCVCTSLNTTLGFWKIERFMTDGRKYPDTKWGRDMACSTEVPSWLQPVPEAEWPKHD